MKFKSKESRAEISKTILNQLSKDLSSLTMLIMPENCSGKSDFTAEGFYELLETSVEDIKVNLDNLKYIFQKD